MDPFYRRVLDKPTETIGILTAVLGVFTWIWARMLKPFLTHIEKRNKLFADLAEAALQLKPNGGSSLWDKIRSIEERQIQMDLRQWCFFSTSDVGVFETDHEGCITKISQAYTRWTGRGAEEFMGWGWQNAIHPAHLDEVADAWADAVREKRRFEHIVTLRSPSGEPIEIVTEAVPIMIHGELKCFFGVGRRRSSGNSR